MGEERTAADAKQFARQLAEYRVATARLAQYIVSVGRAAKIEADKNPVSASGTPWG